jgi:hypothetical protein
MTIKEIMNDPYFKNLCETEKLIEIDESDYHIIETEYQNFLTNFPIVQKDTDIERYKLLLVLKLYNKTKMMQESVDNLHRVHDSYRKKDIYRKNNIDMNDLKKITTKQNNLNQSNELNESNESNESNDFQILGKIYGKDKMMMELMWYELKYSKIIPTINNQINQENQEKQTKLEFTKDTSEMYGNWILSELNRFSLLIAPEILEDKTWDVLYRSTKILGIPSDAVVFANTVPITGYDGAKLSDFLDMITSYLERIFTTRSIHYVIQEDVKYQINWVLVVIRYHVGKIE